MTGRRGPDRRRFLRLGVGAAIPVAGAGCAALPLDDGDERELRSISYGETKAGFVATGDGIDPVFEHAAEPVSFEGTAGDGVAITMTATGSGSMDPYAVLEDPSGPVLTGPTGRRADAVVVETPLPASGTYTIWASTEDRLGDGPYELTLERTVDAADRPDRPDLRAVGYGETASGYVDALDGADPEYGDLAEPVAFDGRSGDGVAVTMAVSDADAEPYPVLAGPGGGTVAETADDPDGSTTVTATLPATGSYTAWAGSSSGIWTGPYTLTLERTGDDSLDR